MGSLRLRFWLAAMDASLWAKYAAIGVEAYDIAEVCERVWDYALERAAAATDWGDV